jgi:hypothetical protein
MNGSTFSRIRDELGPLPSAGGALEGCEVQVGLGPVGRDYPAIGQQIASVLEHDDAVAEQAPSLLWAGGHDPGSLAIRRVRRRAGRLMLTVHGGS